jgi:hypothetical protein
MSNGWQAVDLCGVDGMRASTLSPEQKLRQKLRKMRVDHMSGRNLSGDSRNPIAQLGSSPSARSKLSQQVAMCEENGSRWIHLETANVRALLAEVDEVQRELEVVSRMLDRADSRQLSSED